MAHAALLPSRRCRSAAGVGRAAPRTCCSSNAVVAARRSTRARVSTNAGACLQHAGVAAPMTASFTATVPLRLIWRPA
jgi:hypothetical protein